MRKLFSFRSSTSTNGTSDRVPPPAPPDNEELYWEAPFGIGDDAQLSKALKQLPERQNYAPCSGLRRSLSFSSATNRGSPTSSSNVQHSSDFLVGCRSLTPERQSKANRGEGAATRKPYGAEKLESPCSSKNSHDTTGNSSFGSPPVPHKLDSTHLIQVSNKVLDLYIDGEQHQDKNSRTKNNSMKNTSSNGIGGGWRPPRIQTTAPASPTDIRKAKARSYSFRDMRDTHPSIPREWKRTEFGPESPQKLARNVVERLSQVFPQKSKTRSRDIVPDTPTTVEDIFEDFLDPYPSNSDMITQKNCVSDIPYRTMGGYSGEEIQDFQNNSLFVGDAPVTTHLAQTEEEVDMELHRRAEEARERVMLISEEIEQDDLLRGNDFSISELFQTIRSLTKERRNLAMEVSTQIQCRIFERESAREAHRVAKVELDSRTRRLEKEKNELQLGLEKELDRRSSDWSFKLEKYQSEEQRLRERVRELAEQNVSLQREVSSLNGRDVENKNKMTNSELQLKDLTAKLEEARQENLDLQESLSECQEKFKGAETDRDCISRSYKEKEKENKELQKTVARLQRTCSEQEKTITGLRQGFGEDIGRKGSFDYDEHKWKMEQVRLTGVEQILRREVESYRLEVESLRHENINLLDRLQNSGTEGGSSYFKLEQELKDRVYCLQNQGLSLFGESSDLCQKLLGFIKGKTNQIAGHVQEVGKNELDGYFIVESNMKVQSFKRGIENLTRSLQTISSVLDEKSKQVASHSHSVHTESGGLWKLKDQALEDDIGLKLKAETLLTSLLREKLFSRQQEVEQLQAELATASRGHDILRSEVQDALDSLSSASHKMKDLELQMLKKDDSINQLKSKLQECEKDLSSKNSVLPKITEERDFLWEQLKQCTEQNMLLNSEVTMLRKKIETLDEDIHIKEGQITILKDSLGNKPFDFLYSPKSMQEFRLD
ncbi:hypothetical protein BVC80_1719g72 [Macleaya cordata]|uniref:DUF7653 domain-containing protein n=1 Tax=Macleaya cordata TaxID=56857 RepID=A0A200Q2Q4_MACCD|nr:hypothetical protein BVC80_1719g72 [Macleaya cordata]